MAYWKDNYNDKITNDNEHNATHITSRHVDVCALGACFLMKTWWKWKKMRIYTHGNSVQYGWMAKIRRIHMQTITINSIYMWHNDVKIHIFTCLGLIYYDFPVHFSLPFNLPASLPLFHAVLSHLLPPRTHIYTLNKDCDSISIAINAHGHWGWFIAAGWLMQM